MIKRIFIIFFFFQFTVFSSYSQQFFTRNYNINDGLPDNCISSIYRDSLGFLWIGTPAGLAHYDGKNFKIFSLLDGLAGNNINDITESENGTMWFSCYKGGISKFDGQKFQSLTSNDGLINNNVTKLFYCQPYKLLLVGTTDGLSVYDGNSFISFHLSLNNVRQRIHVTGFLKSKNAVYVLTLGNGLYKFLPETRKLTRVSSDNKLNENTLFAAHITPGKDTLISINRKGFKIVNNHTGYYDSIGQVECFASDNDSTVWIGCWQNNNSNTGGLYKFKNNTITKYNGFLGIESEKIKSLLFDTNENILWIGTEDNGLYMFPGEVFTYYPANYFNLNKLSITDLIFDDSKNLWILTEHTVIKKLPNNNYKVFNFNLFHEKFIEYKENELKHKYQYLIDKEGSYEKYQSLIERNIYKYSNPYIKINNAKIELLEKGSLYKPNKYEIIIEKNLYQFTNLKSDKYGNIWVGSNAGLFKIDKILNSIEYFDLDGNYFTHFTFGTENELVTTSWDDAIIYPGFENNPVLNQAHFSLKHGPKNVRKIKSTKNTAWFLDNDHDIYSYKSFQFNFLNQDSSEYHTINDFCFDNSGNIILGGNGGTVYIFGQNENRFTVKHKISKQNGLSGTNIRWVNCAADNHLYIGTNSGVNIINLNQLYTTGEIEIKKLYKVEGFTDYSGTVSVTDTEKNLWIGTNSQLVKIKTTDIDYNKSKNLSFVMKSIEVNDEPFPVYEKDSGNLHTYLTENTIALPWYKNSISFNYDVLKFINAENIRFVYTLQNGKRIDTKETRERKLEFQNLKSGKYIFKIHAFSDRGNIVSSEIKVRFIIKQAFWKNGWIILSFTLLIILLTWRILHHRTRRIKQKERKRIELAEKITEFEIKALRAQMNPHFIFNAINSIQNYMLSNDVDAALNYLSDFAKLIRITLENVSKKMVSIEEELNYIKYYLRLEQMRFDKKFDTQINIANDVDSNKLLIPPMILQPYIENAIKHGLINKDDEGVLKIELFIISNKSEQFLHCIIEDNGVGRIKSEELTKGIKKSHTSKSTYITNERLSLLNQTNHRKGYRVETTDLYDENKNPAGTRVEIIFPI